MARNEEKSHGMMNKWTAMRAGTIGGKKGTQAQIRQRQLSHLRPTECHDLSEAELARKVLMRTLNMKIDEIQNAGMGEHMIKELNDEINEKLRRKRKWEKRIIELGGPNYIRLAPKVFDGDGRELPGDGGYKYFGAARTLPMVQRLFEKKKRGAARRSKNQILNGIRSDYFSLDTSGEDNGAILRAEGAVEASLLARHEANIKNRRNDYTSGNPFDPVALAVRESKTITLADICREEVEPTKVVDDGNDLETMRKQLLARLG
jgi:pre-mRNA-splicing factor ISY1